jgi:hypothetical protein
MRPGHHRRCKRIISGFGKLLSLLLLFAAFAGSRRLALHELRLSWGKRGLTPTMENSELTATIYGEWKASDVAYLSELRWVGYDGSSLAVVAIVQPRSSVRPVWPDEAGPWYRAVLQFDGVCGLNVKDFGPCRRQIMGFSVERIADRGFERLNYHVEDYENGAIEFYARTAELLSVEALSNTGPRTVE